MSSNDQTTKATTESKADPQISFNQTVRDAGFRNFNDFLLSYGLRMNNHDDVLEGKAILRAMFPERKNI